MGIRKTLQNLLGFKSDLASLTVVGVGPGDSSLLTIAAVEACLLYTSDAADE